MDIAPYVSIKNTDNTSTGAILKLSNSRGANAGVDNDVAGEIRFLNNDSANNNQSFGNIKVTASDVTTTSEIGKLELGVACSTKGDVKSALTIEGGVEEKNIETQVKGNLRVRSGLPPMLIDTPNPNFDIPAGKIKSFSSADVRTTAAAFDSLGNMYCTWYANNTYIYKLTPDGTLDTTFYDVGVNYIYPIAINAKDEMFVATWGSSELVKKIVLNNGEVVSCDTHFTYAEKLASGEKIISLQFNSKNELFAGLNGSKRIMKISPDSDATVSLYFSPGAGGGDTRGLTVDSNDVLYTADRTDYKVYKLIDDGSGNITRTLLAGSTQGVLVNGNGSAAKFHQIMDIQSDRQNNIYVV